MFLRRLTEKDEKTHGGLWIKRDKYGNCDQAEGKR